MKRRNDLDVSSSKKKFAIFLISRRRRIDRILRKNLASITQNSPRKLADAMKYAVLAGGKRLRSLLVYAVGEAYGASTASLDQLACAIEFVHSFSLVHDDLPAMDNDTLRRGKPTCHVKFNEATAILVGDALLVAALQLIGEAKGITAEKRVMMINILATASGAQGMAGGQYLDLHPTIGGGSMTVNKLKKIYHLKTGTLIGAAMQLGAVAAGVGFKRLKLLAKLALNVGFAFQIRDDILDIKGNIGRLGKNIGSDKAQNKVTIPVLVGIKRADTKIAKLQQKNGEIIRQLQMNSGIMPELVDRIVKSEL